MFQKNNSPEARKSQLLLKAPLLVPGPAGIRLVRVQHFLVMKAHWVPARHDVKGDDTAQRVRDYGHLPVFLKVWVSRAEERVQAVQLQSQTPRDLHKQTTAITHYLILLDICSRFCSVITQCHAAFDLTIRIETKPKAGCVS